MSNYLKKLEEIKAKAYGTQGEKNHSTSSSSNGNSTSHSVLDRIKSKIDGTYYGDMDINAVKSWFTESESTIKGMNDYYKANEGKWVSNYGGDYINSISTLKNKSKAIGAYLRDHKDEFSDYESLSKAHSDYSTYLEEIEKQVSSMRDLYSQFADEREYNNWYKNEGYWGEQKNTVTNAEDFGEYSQMGAGVTNPTWDEAHAPINIAGWKPLGDGKTVNNMVTFAETYGADAYESSAEKLRAGGASGQYDEIVHLINTQMKDDEKAIYNYYVGKGDTKKAEEYLTYITDVLRQREAGKIVEKVDNTALEAVFSAAAGLDQWFSGVKNIDNYLTGKEADQTSTIQYAQGAMSSNNKGIWKVTNDLISNTANMAPSILVSLIPGGAVAGKVAFGAGAIGNAYSEMRNLGYEDWQASGYATLVGASEVALQSLLGGIGKLGGKYSVTSGITKLVDKFDHALAKLAIQVPLNMASEGLEEAIQTVLEPHFKAAFTGEDFEGAEWDEILYSALLGALSAGALEGVPNAIGTVGESLYVNKLKNAYGSDIEAILTEAGTNKNTSDAIDKYINKYEKNGTLSGWEIDKILEISDNAKVKSAVEAKLTSLGEKGDVSQLADIITKQAQGIELSKNEQKILDSSSYGQRMVNSLDPEKINSGEYETEWSENIGTRRFNAQAYNKGISEASEASSPKAETIPVSETAVLKENATEAKIKASVSVKNSEGKTVNAEIQSVEVNGDEANFTLSNGEKVESDKVAFKSDNEKFVADIAIEKVSRVEGFSNEAATAMIKGYDGSISPTQYTKAFDDAFDMGANGVPSSKLVGVINSGVSERVAYTAYELGRKSSEKGESDLKSLSNNGIINTNKSEAKNESGESIRIRNGGKRDGGKNTERQVSRVEGGTRQAESRGKASRVADSEATRLVNEGREVKVADLGILGGSTEQTVRLVDKENETSSMKEARKRAEERGLKVTFFVGDNLVIKDKSGEWISARAYIKGEHVFVRADHSLYTADQLMRHELGHDMIAKGEVDIEAVRERLEATVGKDKIDEVAEHYANAYEGSGLSPEDIWEECICDSLGDMNIFAGNKAVGTFLDQMLPDIKAATNETKSPTQTRGSPDGKASRETGQYSEEDYKNFGWVRQNDVINAGYWRNFTENFAQAVSKLQKYPKSKSGEFMISVYDVYSESEVDDVIVFAKGTIESPDITKIVKFNLIDESDIYPKRRNLYEAERRGVRTATGEIFDIHYKADYVGGFRKQGNGTESNRNNNELGVKRSRSEITANPVIKSEVNEDEGTVTVTYKNGDVVTEPWGKGKASRELDTDSTEYKINTSMTMAEAKRMIETAYKVNGIAEYYEGEYKDAEDWLKKAGSDEVEMYIENDYDLQAKYINSNEDILNEEYRISDVLEAYLAGTLIGKEKPKPKRLDISQSTRLKDDRFYSPQKIEDAKATFELANQKAVGKDANAINRARAEILLFAHNKGAAELLGVTQSELNKKLRSWSNYSATAKNISERINAGVAEENRWTGIENSSYISKARVSNEDIERLVASVEGDSKGYERKYIARVMLAADTHIDYSGLKFKFASSQQVNEDHSGGNSGGRVLGFYDDTNRQIEVTHDKPNTVAHEMGHYIDAQWGRELVGSKGSHLFLTRGVNADIVRERYGEPGVQFLNNFKLFINSLSDVNQTYNSYYNDRGEIFARFFARFIEWTDNIATGNKYYSYESTMYGDKFTQAQYVEFARLLQEKALLDGTLKENRQHGKASRELDTERVSYAPTFYSHMGKVIDDVKLDKMGTSSILNHLKNRGVKDEEIKWSGIETFLEGKKSVTKAELQEFVAGSQLVIEEDISGINNDAYTELDSLWREYFYNQLEDTFDPEDFDSLKVKAELAVLEDMEYDMPSKEIQERMAKLADSIGKPTRWEQYKLEGGTNYRELVFKLPNSSYSNRAMRGHWGQDAEGVLVRARMQDFNVDGKRMLFIEELQSDWHNEGREKGYSTPEYEDTVAVYNKLADEYGKVRQAFNKYVRSSEFRSDPDEVSKKKFNWLRNKMDTAEKRMQDAERDVEALKKKGMGDVADAPFRDNYHEYVLKRLLRMAAEEGYDSIGWTIADTQSKRWSYDYEKAYQIEYDQEMPKFLRKYGKKWGASVGKSSVADTEIWSMDITDSMKESVLYEGQAKYSRELDFIDFINEQAGEESDPNLTKTQKVARVRGELEEMYVETKDVISLADSYFDNYGGVMNKSEIRYGFLHAMKTMLGKSADAFDKAYYEIAGIAEELVYNPKDLGSVANDFKEMKNYVRGIKFKVQDRDKPEFDIYGGFGTFRKEHMGKLTLANNGIAIDSVYPELQSLYGTSYFPDVNTVAEQLMVIADIVDTPLSSVADVGYDVEAAKEYTVQEILDKFISHIEESYKREQSSKTKDASNINYRNPDSYSNRSLLANALETAVQNDIERNKLKQYKEKIDLINSEEQKLRDLREQIKELSFAKGARDTEAIKNLQFEANQAANRINTYDKQLLNLESTKALRGVLEREKAQVRKREMQRYKEALEKYREKAAETHRELMTRYQESRKRATESRNKTAMRHKIKDVVNELNNYLLKGTKDKHVPIELQKAVAEALDAVNMDTVGAEERIAKKRAEMMSAKTPEAVEKLAKEIEHIQEMGGNMEAKISRLKTAYDSIINSEDPLVANSFDEVISNTIDKVMEVVGDTPLRDMSLYQLEAVYDMYKMVLHSVRTANKAFKAKKSEEISVIANRVLEEVDKLRKKKALQTKTGEALSTFGWNNLKPVYAFERIGSETFTEVFENVRAGEDTWAVDMSEAREFLENQKEKYKYDSWDFDKKYDFTSSTGKEFSLSLGQILSLYAYSKRGDQAKDHLKNGGFVFDGLTTVKEKGKLGITKTYQLKDATAYKLGDGVLDQIISVLDSKELSGVKDFADAMQDYLSTVMGEKGNEVSLELYGVKLFKEKNYFPLKSAPQFLERAREQAQGETKIKNKGFTKETTPKAKNPIVLTSFMDVWVGHVNEMSMYHAFTLALEDFYRVFNYKTPASETMDSESVISFLENAHGNASVAYIDQLLKDLNGGARSDPRETLAKSLMSKFKKASVMASLSVVIQQPSAIVRAQALVDAKYFVGKKVSQGKHKEIWAEVKKYAPVAIIKEMGYFDVGMGQSSTEWLKGEKSFMDKVDDVLSKAPALADEYTWCAIWNAVKRETAHNNPTLKTSSEEFLKLCGERFTEVITKTQVYDSTLARSANMRSKSGLMAMWTAFMAEPTTALNMLADAFRKGNKKYIARTFGAVAGSVILNSALVSLVYAMRDDDEDETFLEKYLSRFTTEVIDGVNPLTYIPFVKDIWSALQGYDIERADMTLITSVIDSFEALIKVVSKDTSDMDEDELSEHSKALNEAILGITDNIASLTGIPVKNIRRDFNGIVNLFKTLGRDMETSVGSITDNIVEDLKSSIPIWGWLPDEKKGDKLYDAIIKGDEAYEERLKSGYKSDSAYDSAIRKALRDNDPRIKEAAEARYEGDIAEYKRIAKEIITEGNFDQDTVVGAINSEINAIKSEQSGEETSENKKDEDTSIYSSSDINTAFDNGDTALAKEIIQDLIDTKVANGKTEKEAKSSLRSSMTSYWKPLYIAASESERIRIRKILYNSGLYGNADEVIKSVDAWLKD